MGDVQRLREEDDDAGLLPPLVKGASIHYGGPQIKGGEQCPELSRNSKGWKGGGGAREVAAGS